MYLVVYGNEGWGAGSDIALHSGLGTKVHQRRTLRVPELGG